MLYCTECGENLKSEAKFCSNCGAKIIKSRTTEEKKTFSKMSLLDENEINKVNKKIKLQNSQSRVVKGSWYSAGLFLLIIVMAFMNIDALPIHPAIVMISIFLFIMSVVIGFMFRSREKKLQSLITGEKLLASWTLTTVQKKAYVKYLFEHKKGKNLAILKVISVMAIIIFGVFILVIDEGKLAMFFVLIGLLLFLAFFAL